MKRKRILYTALACMPVLIASAMLSAGIVNSEAIILGTDGKASIPIVVATGLDKVGGIQGEILYDPAKIENITLSPSLDQAASFVIRSHITAPGTLKFLTYSKYKSLVNDRPVFYCNVVAKSTGDLKKFNSVLVCEVELSSSPEAQTQSETNSYVNLPVLGAPETAVRKKWVLYSK